MATISPEFGPYEGMDAFFMEQTDAVLSRIYSEHFLPGETRGMRVFII